MGGRGSVYLIVFRYQENVLFPRLGGLYQDITHDHGMCGYNVAGPQSLSMSKPADNPGSAVDNGQRQTSQGTQV